MKRKTSKELLADSFREIAESRPIDRITVKDITENCGYSSATFYRQFRDKYDLIAWDYTRDLAAIMDQTRYDEISWRQILTRVAAYFGEQREYIANLLTHTSGYDSFVGNMTEIHFNCLKYIILKSENCDTLDEKTEMYIRLYIHGSVRLSCEWILGGYGVDAGALTEIYENSLPGPLRQYLSEK